MRSTNQLATASLFKVTKYFKTPIISDFVHGVSLFDYEIQQKIVS